MVGECRLQGTLLRYAGELQFVVLKHETKHTYQPRVVDFTDEIESRIPSAAVVIRALSDNRAAS